MSKYAAKFLQPGEEPPADWTQVFNNQGSWTIAVDTNGIASPADYPFVPGVDNSHDLNSYIIISDTKTTNLAGRPTGGNTGIAPIETPTYWATKLKNQQSFLELVNRLPANNQTFINGISALGWLNLNGYWCSYDSTLLLYVDAMNNNSYPSSGSTWFDLSFMSNNGTINNAVFTSIGGKYTFNFDGLNSFVSINKPIKNGSNYSIFAWVYAKTTVGSRNIVSSQDSPFWISNGILYAGVGGDYQVVHYNGDGTGFPVNVWKHVAMTFNYKTNTMKLYVDGQEVDSNNNVMGIYTEQDTFIGSHFYGGANTSFWNGYITEVSIYDVEKTSIEVSNHFNSTLSLRGFSPL